jgi:hypothetical protein
MTSRQRELLVALSTEILPPAALLVIPEHQSSPDNPSSHPPHRTPTHVLTNKFTTTTALLFSSTQYTATLTMSFDSPLPPYNASDPAAQFLNSSCLDFLMIELVPMAYRVVNEVDAAAGDDRLVYGAGGKDKEDSVAGTAGGSVSVRAGDGTGDARKMDEDEERDAVFFRLESLGYRVGQGLVERFVVVLLLFLATLYSSSVLGKQRTLLHVGSSTGYMLISV